MPFIYVVIKGTEFLSIIETLKTPFKVMFLLEMQAARGSVVPPYGRREWGAVGSSEGFCEVQGFLNSPAALHVCFLASCQ